MGNQSIRFQDIEQKLNYDGMTEREINRKNDEQGESSIALCFVRAMSTKGNNLIKVKLPPMLWVLSRIASNEAVLMSIFSIKPVLWVLIRVASNKAIGNSFKD